VNKDQSVHVATKVSAVHEAIKANEDAAVNEENLDAQASPVLQEKREHKVRQV
jgi:hypothetical protein